MPLTISTNIASLKAQRQMSFAIDALSASRERLSSGMRINKASDDAAGLAIADSLKNDVKLAKVAVRNANDGISVLNVADGALGSISDILQRMAELAEQSANGTYQATQRSPLQAEFLALASEIERIATITAFNQTTLINNSNTVTIQIGFNSASSSQIQFQNFRSTLSGISLAVTGSSVLTYSIIAGNQSDSQTAAQTALQAVTAAIEAVASGRGAVGAAQSRLQVAINNLQSASENFQAAESRIRDVDVASESAEMIRLQILTNASQSILVQANQQPALVLKLLDLA